MKLVYLKYEDGTETRIFVRDVDFDSCCALWQRNNTVAFVYTPSEETILQELSRCHDVFEARWLMEEIDFWAEDLKEYNLPKYLTDAAKAIYAEDDGLKSAKATREFLNEYLG